jgi:hypothetical protein
MTDTDITTKREHDAHGGGHDHKKLHVAVLAPRSPKPKKFTWDQHLLVRDAAADAAQAFGYTGGTPALSKDDKVLDGDQELAQAGVRDGDTLELLDKGGGV